MNYKEAIQHLDSLQSTKIELSLERIEKVCKEMLHPERDFNSVVIAGTNGKGSTAAFLESLLRHSGLRSGLYTSPHLEDVRERIAIDRRMISKADFARLATLVRNVSLPLTYFEFITMIAFLYFREKQVDIAVLEVGLGGRLDATNVVVPQVSVITRIAMDHQKYLGDSTEKIAFEKCGIIKTNVPVVTCDQQECAMNVIRRVAEENGSLLHVVNPCEVKYKLGLQGRHQAENASLALRAFEIVINATGGSLSEKIVARALLSTKWPGRLEVVSDDPLIILDGAHNPNGARALASFIADLKRERGLSVTVVFAVMADKDVEGIVKELIPVVDEWIITRPSLERAMEPRKILDIIRNASHKAKVRVVEPLNDALRTAKANLQKDQFLVITGSLYLIGEASASPDFRNGTPVKM